MKKINIGNALILLVGVLFFYSCTENQELLEETRLFRPVLSHDLLAANNTIIVDMGKMKAAVSYKIELSRDNFQTVTKTVETVNSKVVITNLLWNTLYQVRAIAYAADPAYNSFVSALGEVKTDRSPSILQIPSAVDIIDNGLNVRWIVSGAAVTSVKIFAAVDEELRTSLFSYNTTIGEQTTGLKSVKGLVASTSYQVAIYSGTVLRGFETFTTKVAIPTTGTLVDLRGIVVPTPDDGTFLFNALTNAPAGSTVILDGDQTYLLSATYFFNKSLTIKSGYSLTSGGAIIDFANSPAQFEIAAAATIASIVIDGVTFIGNATKYVFNAGTAATSSVGELKFVNCKMTSFRNLIRTRVQWVSGAINQLTVDNCIMSDFTNAGMIAVDATANNPVPKITLKNTTFWKVLKLINNRATTNSTNLIISDCTFSESPKGGQLIEYVNTTNITGGIQVTNTIFGRGADNGGLTPFDNPFIKSGNLPSTVMTFSNVYKTNDFVFTATTVPSSTIVYAGSITALWVDPLNGDFRFKDTGFAGKSTAGDPRFRL